MPSGQALSVFTVGHSNHPREHFAKELLHQHRIAVLADVRSAPYSRFAPDFDREALRSFLVASDIRYVYFGDELGGRPSDPACYENGRVRYDRVAGAASFRRGLDGLLAEAASHRVAVMCSEKEPLHCHRTLLVAQALDGQDIGVEHILADGSLASHAAVIDDLLAKHNLSDAQTDLFPRTREERVKEAVARQAREVGFALGEGHLPTPTGASTHEPWHPPYSSSPQPRRTAT